MQRSPAFIHEFRPRDTQTGDERVVSLNGAPTHVSTDHDLVDVIVFGRVPQIRVRTLSAICREEVCETETAARFISEFLSHSY